MSYEITTEKGPITLHFDGPLYLNREAIIAHADEYGIQRYQPSEKFWPHTEFCALLKQQWSLALESKPQHLKLEEMIISADELTGISAWYLTSSLKPVKEYHDEPPHPARLELISHLVDTLPVAHLGLRRLLEDYHISAPRP